MVWKVPKIWNKADVWIIGGGPSICEQFAIPKNVVTKAKETKNPKLLGNRMKFLHDKRVIGVNAAFLLGDWIDWVFFGDNVFFLRNTEKLAKFPGLCVTCASNTSASSWIKILLSNTRTNYGIAS